MGSRFMVCGPGVSERAGEFFGKGYVPVFEEADDWRESVRLLADCRGVYMARGWRGDRLARLLHFIALKLGMEVMVER